MKKLIIITLISLQLLAQNTNSSKNPNIYSALGDKIYDNVKNIYNLITIAEYESSREKIKKYTTKVRKTKRFGFKIQNENKDIDKGTYLKALRELSATNDYFINSVNTHFENSIKNENSILFLNCVNSGLISIPKNKKTIKKYYYSHKNEINPKGIIQNIINKDNKKPVYKGLTKAQKEKNEIKRIRKKDKAKQKAIEKSLEDEVIRKKIKIRKDQKEELKTISN